MRAVTKELAASIEAKIDAAYDAGLRVGNSGNDALRHALNLHWVKLAATRDALHQDDPTRARLGDIMEKLCTLIDEYTAPFEEMTGTLELRTGTSDQPGALLLSMPVKVEVPGV